MKLRINYYKDSHFSTIQNYEKRDKLLGGSQTWPYKNPFSYNNKKKTNI